MAMISTGDDTRISMPAAVSRARSSKHITLILLAVLFLSIDVCAQNAVPSRTQCKQWDDNYLFLLNLFLLAGVFLPLALNLFLPPLLGRRIWMLTAPRMRIFYTSLIVAIVLTTVLVGVPFVFGFGRFIFSGIDQTYFICETMRFGATGLVFGLVGSGIAAVSQWLAMLMLLTVSCLLGGVIALVTSKILASYVGLRARVRGGS
jgi:hypothetical protein